MFKATHARHAPWNIIHSDDKRRARLNCIAHLLKSIPYKQAFHELVKLPKRSNRDRFNDQRALRSVNLVAELF
jgi:hypothetical protein